MTSWRDMAAAHLHALPTEPDMGNSEPSDYGLPASIADNLRRLGFMAPPPKLADPNGWRRAIEDAQRLARDGWAATALDLGWSVHDLFGIGPKDDWQFTGLAVWLAGRSIRLLDERRAVACGQAGRLDFIRGGMGHGTHPTIAPVLLWEFGR